MSESVRSETIEKEFTKTLRGSNRMGGGWYVRIGSGLLTEEDDNDL